MIVAVLLLVFLMMWCLIVGVIITLLASGASTPNPVGTTMFFLITACMAGFLVATSLRVRKLLLGHVEVCVGPTSASVFEGVGQRGRSRVFDMGEITNVETAVHQSGRRSWQYGLVLLGPFPRFEFGLGMPRDRLAFILAELQEHVRQAAKAQVSAARADATG